MSISSTCDKYLSHSKEEWRLHNYSEIMNRSLYVNGGKLIGKWIEPVGVDATCFNSIMRQDIIDEADLIGIDRNPNTPHISHANIVRCMTLFPSANFYCKDWCEYCLESDDVAGYIIYDLYTSTHGQSIYDNLNATCTLVNTALRSRTQVILVINADINVMNRQRRNKNEFREMISKIFKTNKLKHSKIDTENMYLYKNSPTSDVMGTIIVELYK